MRGLEKAMEWLRPLVEKKTWDYCIVWKLGDDPSRFVEWMDCCCGGGYGLANVKVEREGQHLPPLCRDRYSQHPVRTRACEALAQFPSFMPLYSGIHGEVVVSTQPRWLSHGTALDSNLSHELVGTQVLIPVVGGLIELFIAKHVPKDQNIIDFVTAQCHISSEQEVRSCNSVSPNENSLDPLLGKYGDNLPPPLLHLSSILQLQFLPPSTQPSMLCGFEGSSNVSDRLNEHPSLDSSSCLAPRHKSLKRPIEKSSFSTDHHYNATLLKQQLGLGLGLVSATPMVEKENEKARQKPESEQYHSKNLITERNRRNRIKDGLFTLRALVPKISKMDRASILGDAIQYIVELQQEVKKLQDQVNMEQEDSNMKDAELKRSSRYSPATTEHNRGSSSIHEKKQIESQRAQVEVKLIGTREFLLKLLCEQKQGGFARLMEAINVLGLQVVDANITTFNGKVLNIFRVEAREIRKYIEIHWDEKKKRASCDSENEAFTLSIESSPVHVSSLHLV